MSPIEWDVAIKVNKIMTLGTCQLLDIEFFLFPFGLILLQISEDFIITYILIIKIVIIYMYVCINFCILLFLNDEISNWKLFPKTLHYIKWLLTYFHIIIDVYLFLWWYLRTLFLVFRPREAKLCLLWSVTNRQITIDCNSPNQCIVLSGDWQPDMFL